MRRSIPLNLALAFGLSACASQPAPPLRAATPPSPAWAAAPASIAPAAEPAAPETPAAPVAAIDVFATRVRPVLSQRCTPCHEPAGVMYERMPFDKPETIRGHPEGVLRRLKGDDRAAVEAWLQGN